MCVYRSFCGLETIPSDECIKFLYLGFISLFFCVVLLWGLFLCSMFLKTSCWELHVQKVLMCSCAVCGLPLKASGWSLSFANLSFAFPYRQMPSSRWMLIWEPLFSCWNTWTTSVAQVAISQPLSSYYKSHSKPSSCVLSQHFKLVSLFLTLEICEHGYADTLCLGHK